MPSPTVLLAEDDPVIARHICCVLEEFGLRVVACEYAEDLPVFCERDRPDVILLNFLWRTSLDGMALAGLLRPRFQGSVRFITGARPQDVAASGALVAGTDILYKPFTTAQLRRWVSGWLG